MTRTRKRNSNVEKIKEVSKGHSRLTSILSRFNHVKERSDGRYSAKCPAHQNWGNVNSRLICLAVDDILTNLRNRSWVHQENH